MMASLSASTLPTKGRQGNIVPASVIAEKRRQRDERRRMLARTMAVDGIEEARTQ